MSDVSYAFSEPCGMEMIIIVIIQYLNALLPVQTVLWESHAPRDPVLVFVCHRNHVNGDIETGLPDREKSVEKFLFLQFSRGNTG